MPPAPLITIVRLCIALGLAAWSPLLPAQDCHRVHRQVEGFFNDMPRLSTENLDSCIITGREIERLSLQCPDSCAYYLVNAVRFITEVHPSLDSVEHYIQKAEDYFARYGHTMKRDDYYTSLLSTRYNRCRFWRHMGQYDQAYPCFEALYDSIPPDVNNSYIESLPYVIPSQLGGLHYANGNYPEALNWNLTALENVDESNPLYAGTCHFYLGRTHIKLGNTETALKELRHSARILENVDPAIRDRTDDFLLDTYLELCGYYLDIGMPDSALTTIENAFFLELMEMWNRPLILQKKGEILTEMERYDEARKNFELALSIADSIQQGRHYRRGMIFYSLAKCYLKEAKPGLALESTHRALAELNEHFPANASYELNPDPARTITKHELLSVLLLKGRILQNMSDEDPVKWLEGALKSYETALSLIQFLRFEYHADVSKELLSHQSFQLFENALAVCIKLYDRTKDNHYLYTAFAFAEKSKALSMLESLTDISARQFAGIPQEILDAERDLKLRAAAYERWAETASTEQDRRSNRLLAFSERQKLDSLRNHLEISYPGYYELKYSLSIISPEDLQAQLAPDETFVEYFWGDKHLYYFTVTSRGARFDALPATDSLRQKVLHFASLAADRRGQNRAENMKQFIHSGHELYAELIAPLQLSTPRVIIAADAWLHLLPFDALLTGMGDFAEYSQFPFLIRQHQITRVFSASVLGQHLNNQTRLTTPKNLLLISPMTDGQRKLPGDPYALIRPFGGDTLLYASASKLRFFENAGSYRYIVFYAHASADTLEPYIRLHNENLYLRDLYAKAIGAELVVLAACEAGKGEIKRGEGIMSLARAFAYSGVPVVSLTLWEVRSGTTLQLTEDFLKNHIEKRLPPDEAIHQAKLAFLDDPPRGDASPFLWSGFVLVGR